MARSQVPFMCVGNVTTLLLAETKEMEIMDTSSKQQRTYEESERERVGSKVEKAKSLKLETEKSEERKKKEDQKKSKGGGKECIISSTGTVEGHHQSMSVHFFQE